jgi:hypothetical protein
MKQFISLAFIITAFLGMTSCTKDNSTPNDTAAPTGQWVVQFYWDQKDETADFSGYTFEFQSGGTLKATKGGITVNGTWSESSSDFTIEFGADPLLSSISNKWLKTEKTDTVIKLKDDNPAQDDQLHFARR